MNSSRFDAQVLDARVTFDEQALLQPLQISSGSIRHLTQATAEVRVRTAGREALGRGSIYLSDLWAWPDPLLTHPYRDGVMRNLCEQMARQLPALCAEPAHPLELGLRLHHGVMDSPGEAPLLARGVCASPFDAAIHDAVGLAHNCSAFNFYDEPTAIASADALFPPGQDDVSGACCAVRALLRRQPQRRLPAWYLVGRHDQLETDMKPWAVQRGYRCFKIKILAKDLRDDAQRTAEVFRAARGWGVRDIVLSADSNEGHSSAEQVLEYLQLLRELDRDAFAALAYLEQPTGRDILRCRQDWRRVAAVKPVLLDEGLTSLELLPELQSQGWSGLAMKTCKGHSFTLVAAAWAKRHGLLLALQDLTNPGYSAIHSYLFGAFVPTINGIELNSPQFTPGANAPWAASLPELFEPCDGFHALRGDIPNGLGSRLVVVS